MLEAMGGTLKADDAELAYKQEKKAKLARSAKDLVRVTAMFSATMPPAVEKMAKKYLRHPAIVQARSIPHVITFVFYQRVCCPQIRSVNACARTDAVNALRDGRTDGGGGAQVYVPQLEKGRTVCGGWRVAGRHHARRDVRRCGSLYESQKGKV